MAGVGKPVVGNEKPAGQTSEGVTVLSTHPATGLEQRADPPACAGGFWGWVGAAHGGRQ